MNQRNMRDQRLPDPYPLYWPEDWARSKIRHKSTYKVTFVHARDEVFSGLQKLTKDRSLTLSRFVVTTNVPVRLDGLPLAGMSEPTDPGVAVWWLEKDQLRVMACDHWRTVRDNMRAVGLGIEALRTLERCGATQILDQAMRSFGRPALGGGLPDWCIELGLQHLPGTLEDVNDAFRKQVQVRHPDKGGTHDGFIRLQKAAADARQWVVGR